MRTVAFPIIRAAESAAHTAKLLDAPVDDPYDLLPGGNVDDPEEEYDFDRWALVRMVKSGESPFLEGKAPDALTPGEVRELAG